MSSSSTLVNVTDDAELRLVALLGGAYSTTLSVPDCEACIAAGDAAQLLHLIANDKAAMEAFMKMPSVDEAVGCFSILVALLGRANEEQQSKKKSGHAVVTVAQLADALDRAANKETATAQSCQRQIRLLSVLYNLHSSSTLKDKVPLLTRIVAAAGSTPKFAELFLQRPDTTLGALLLADDASGGATAVNGSGAAATTTTTAQQLPRLVHMLDAWKVPPADRRDLYRTVASVLPASDARQQRFQLLLVETYDDDDSSNVNNKNDEPGRLEAARQAAVGAVRDPVTLFALQRNLLHQPAMQALATSSSADDKLLFALLQVFQEGKLQDYQDFVRSNTGNGSAKDEAALLAKWGLDAAACQANIRTLSLCSLATEHGEEIPYRMIADTLQIDEDAVERQVIQAVGSGLLQAKMDQLARKVMVERAVFRRFDVAQWKLLQGRLQTWKSNVGSILASLKQQQQQAAVMATP